MTRPRPDNMFATAGGQTQETSLAPLRDKLLFVEAMVASDELTGRELRLGILLTAHYSTDRGNASPSLDYISKALGTDKRDVAKILKQLEAKGWFAIWRGTRGRGKNHVNRCIPNPQKVPSAAPFKTAVENAKEREKVAPEPPFNVAGNPNPPPEKVAFESVKGGFSPVKGGARATRYVVSLSGHPSDDDTAALRSASACEQANADMRAAPVSYDGKVMAKLQTIQRWLAAPNHRPCTASELGTIRRWRDWCDEINESHDGHTGDPIGGMAQRLANELDWLLEPIPFDDD
jgi:hypothetical protein